jgi:hypothetical protein
VDVEGSNPFSRSRNGEQKRPVRPKGLAGFFLVLPTFRGVLPSLLPTRGRLPIEGTASPLFAIGFACAKSITLAMLARCSMGATVE